MERFLRPKLREVQKKKNKVFSLNWSGFCARKIYGLPYYCNFMINNNMSVRSKLTCMQSL